jgi:hypothetical protein
MSAQCSGDQPRCQQCEMRNSVCEWDRRGEEAPRIMKRKYLALEQRSASEHEVLTYLRTVSEADCMELIRRLREGYSMDDLLMFARDLSSETPPSNRVLLVAKRQHASMPLDEQGLEADHSGEIHSPARPALPPIASISYVSFPLRTSHHTFASSLSLTLRQ